MKTKEEVIKEAWGDDMPACGVDANGWSKKIINDRTLCFIKYDHQQFLMGSIIRPKSLKGIENNNGWIKIESKEDLPIEEGKYYVIRKFHGDIQTTEIYGNIQETKHVSNSWIWNYSHYQRIIEPLKPLY